MKKAIPDMLKVLLGRNLDLFPKASSIVKSLNQDIPLIVAFYPEFHAKCDLLDAVYSASIFRV